MSRVGKGRDESSLLVFPAAQLNQLAALLHQLSDRWLPLRHWVTMSMS